MSSLKVTIQPSVLAVSLAEAKKQLNIEIAFTDDDALITDIIKSATEFAQNEMQTQLMAATLVLSIETLGRNISLERYPVSGTPVLKYFDVNGTEQVIGSTNYRLNDSDRPCTIEIDDDFAIPTLDKRKYPVKIEFVAGYATSAEVPFNVKSAIKLKITDLYEHRGTVENGGVGEVEGFKDLLRAEANWI